MDKAEIQSLINMKSDRVKYVENSGKSVVWKDFKLIELDGSLIQYVKCNSCNSALRWKSRDGTSGLRTHTESCLLPTNSGLRRITDVAGFTTVMKLPNSVKSDIADHAVRMCAKDIRLENSGCVNLI
jgi:hypothetical protein